MVLVLLAALSAGAASIQRSSQLRSNSTKGKQEASHLPSTSSPLALAFVGAQHWVESGIYSDTGLVTDYDGYYCLCGCTDTEEGVFCSGGGLHPDLSPVGQFLVLTTNVAYPVREH